MIETVSTKHPVEKNSWTQGYSMRFVVETPLLGNLGPEVVIETGNGGGDCGTPLPPGSKFLIFAYKEKDGKLWTGMCMGNQKLSGSPDDEQTMRQYQELIKKGSASIFGHIFHARPSWQGADIRDDTPPRPYQGMVLRAESHSFTASTKTKSDGSYEFSELPVGKYKVVPEIPKGLDFSHEYEDNYEADLTKRNNPQGAAAKDRSDPFGSPKPDAPFPPTYYPGVTNQKDASVVSVGLAEVRELELPIREIAKPRSVHFVAIGLDGKPTKAIYVQLEDLRHPGDAGSYVNVDLDHNGAGTLIVYAGYSYHLHGSHYVGSGNDWCSKPVLINAGTEPVDVRFVMDHKEANCAIDEIDELRK